MKKELLALTLLATLPQQNIFQNMTETEIIAHFARYDFRDELGHELILCRDFLDLVSMVSGRLKTQE